jgi:hypothetical protein
MKRPVRFSIARQTILDTAAECLAQVEQWSELHHFGSAAEYYAKAEALIELLEVDDCGSVGGFDRGRGQTTPPRSLSARLKWLTSLPVKS